MAATNANKLAAAKNDVVLDSKEIVGDLKELVDDGLGFLEDSAELVKKSWIVRSNPKVLVATAGLTGFVVGGALGYLIASKKLSSHLERKYILLAEKEIEEARQYYMKKNKTGEFATAEEALIQLSEGIIAAEGYSSEGDSEDVETEIVDGQEIRVVQEFRVEDVIVTPPVKEKIVRKNVFDGRGGPDDEWDEGAELESRGDDPYIIHHDEYMRLVDNSSGGVVNYDQIALTYYEGDSVLTDQREEVISDSNSIVGDDNLTKFGHGSKDPNVVYIRNDAIDTDFEIIKSTGKYSKEVLGFDDPDELQHSDRRQRRNRSADE